MVELWKRGNEDAYEGRAPVPLTHFDTMELADEYGRAYSRAVAKMDKRKSFFGDQKWWQNPTREWDEKPLSNQNSLVRPGGGQFRPNHYPGTSPF